MLQRTKWLRPAFGAVVVLLVAALGVAIYFGYGWGHALIVDKAAATAREEALSGARQAAVNLSSFDSADLDRSFSDIESSITGDTLKKDLEDTKAQITEQLKQTKAKTEATVVDAALTDFSEDQGTGQALVVLSSSTSWPDQPTRKVMSTVRITVEKVDGIWKASKMENVGAPIAEDLGPGQTPGAGGPVPPVPDGAPAPNEPAPAQPAPEQGSGGQ